jgi:ATP-binding cassette subfamily B protein
VIVYQAALGLITIGTLMFLAGAFQRARALVTGILMATARTYEEALSLKDLFEFFDERPRIGSSKNAVTVRNPIRRGLVFDDVGFRYAGADRWAIRGVSMTIAPGDRIALVGENGAGKTTLVKLITRLYDPTEGRILLDGRDLREYDIDSLREAVGVILQDYFRYDLTARENIAVGAIAAGDDLARVVDAAEKSLAADVIGRLEKGYEQLLGRRFEMGADLSGGEWQKIALARAYMRDAQILILDEPTAALDARAEHEIFQRFTKLASSRISVLISHRFSTVRMADRIVVLEDGAVTEQGSHDVLLRAGGQYADLFTLQAAGYR